MAWQDYLVRSHRYSDSVPSIHPHQQQVSVQRRVLAEAYARTPGEYVAFLDESFELDGDRPTFYLLAAVVAHRDDLDDLRDGLRDEVGSDFWHTTESLLTEEGRKTAVQVSTYLGAEGGSEICIVSCKKPIETDGDTARRECFEQLGTALCQGIDPLPGSVHLMVLEQRETRHERSFDEKIVKDLRSDQKICRRCQLKQASPRDEPLLWLPDLVAAAVRREMTHRETELLEPIDRIVTVLSSP